ncbi:Fic/DOC family protein [Bradyrhizobium sp. USDA 3397]
MYDWAGKIRTVRMSKGGNPFCFPENIEDQAKLLFAQLKQDKFLAGLEPEAFAEKAAHFLSELNVIHAFREGNGRAQLSFFLLLADRAGHPIDLKDLDPYAFLNAMITAFDGDEAPLAGVIQVLVENKTD